MDKNIIYTIRNDDVQMVAESLIDRKLTKSELQSVIEEIESNDYEIHNGIGEVIEKVIEYDKLIKRNKDADKNQFYFKTYWKNSNVYINDFQSNASFKNLDDAKKYIYHFHSLDGFDTWKITKSIKGIESEVEIIKNKLE